MVLLEILTEEHRDVVIITQTLEREAQKCLDKNKPLIKDEYLQVIKTCREFFKTRIAKHFHAEETALFPILAEKSSDSNLIIKTMISEHSRIMEMFVDFEIIVDHKQSIKALTDLMVELSEHVRNEDEFFSSIHLTEGEISRFDNIAKNMGIHLA